MQVTTREEIAIKSQWKSHGFASGCHGNYGVKPGHPIGHHTQVALNLSVGSYSKNVIAKMIINYAFVGLVLI